MTGAPTAASSTVRTDTSIQNTKRVWLTHDLMGMDVVSTEGENLGEIEDIVVQPGGETAYAVLSFGGLLGIGGKLFAMPWGVLRSVERDSNDPNSERSLVLPLTKEKLKEAPGFDKDNWPAMANPNWTKDIDTFYEGNSNHTPRTPSQTSAGSSLITWKLSDIHGYEVETPSGDELGEIEELAIDTDGCVSFVALELSNRAGKDDRLIAVPWDAFTFSVGGADGEAKHVTLATPRAQLEQAPLIITDKNRRDEMSDPSWVDRVRETFSN